MQLNRFCASGLEAVNIAAQKVRSGWEDLVLAGGVESMSRVPMGSDGGAWAMDPETNYATGFVPQGIGADLIATIEGFEPRRRRRATPLESQERAAKAWANGYFDALGRAGAGPQRAGRPRPRRAHPARTPRVEALGRAARRPSPRSARWAASTRWRCRSTTGWSEIDHVHTAGNSSGIVDGAALVLVGSRGRRARQPGSPRGPAIVAAAVTGADPTIMLTGPAPATRKALAKAGLTIEDIDLFEINEAFAAVVAAVHARTWASTPSKVNVNGGAIAMGHPLGATGAHDARHAASTSWSGATCATAWPRCASAAAWASPPIIERV